jgi:acyl-CoA reductase-like NAD-dependent aldehyde dehydrogenase/sulfur carrier protein ThiS
VKVDVVCFGAMRRYLPEGTAGNRAEVNLPERARVADAVDAVGAPRRLVFALLVNGLRADLETELEDGAEVTLMPPFTGGSDRRSAAMPETKKKPKSKKAGATMLRSFDPARGRKLGEVRANSPTEVAETVSHARKMAPEWAAIDPRGRAHMLKSVRHRIYDRLDDIVETIAAECGKPRAEALAHDVLPTVLCLQYYERVAPGALRPERAGPLVGPLMGLSSRIHWKPFGVVGHISPWNYPFFMAFIGAAPALFAGNAVVVKPSEVTPQVGERIREVLEPLPAGVATVVQGGRDVGAALVDAPCDKISFIGSPATGRAIAEAAAKHLTPVVMELGGQDSAIVCSDANLDVASSGVLWGAFLNAGQTCCAIERAYVVDAVADDFSAMVTDKLGRVRHGGEDAEIGALTAEHQLETVRRHVADAVDNGARLLAGGPANEKTEDGSLWFPPTVIEGRSEEMAIFDEETFGPVLPIVRVRDEGEAVRRANEEGRNLTSSVWTRDRRKGERIASMLKAGTVSINDHAATAGAPWTPWGGFGESGYGRLNGKLGLREFAVPMHVAASVTPGMKRLWWYPYDEATTGALRAVTELVAAPNVSRKTRALATAASKVGRAIKGKL